MEAVPPLTPWSPKDDFLLKNALENGASMESLAKGAVEFSRRFTIRELLDRWNSLLYDVNTSIKASVRMIEFERSDLKRASKSKKAGNSKSKQNDCDRRKRKAESIRGCYNAWRKRMCSEPLNPGNQTFLGGSFDISGSEPLDGENLLLGGMASHFGLPDASFDDLSVFALAMEDMCGVGESSNELVKGFEDCIEENSVRKEILLGNSMAMAGNSARLGQMDLSKKLLKGDYDFQAIESNLVSDSSLYSPVPDCGTSFDPMQYACSPPAMPDWEEIEGVSVQGLPDDVDIKGNDVLIREPFSISDGGGSGEGPSEYKAINMESFNPGNHMSCDGMIISTDCTDDYLVELADALFNFTNDEIVDDAIDKSYLDGLSSLLLNSPYGAADEMPKISETEEPATPAAYLGTEPAEKIGAAESHLGVHECTSENQIPASASTVNSQLPEYCNGDICCSLNIQDPEIPCNDHIVFPSRPRTASAHRRTQNEPNYSTPRGKDGNGNPASEKGVGTLETSGFELLNHSKNPSTNFEGLRHCGLAVTSELSPVRQSDSGVVDKSCHVSDSGNLQSGVGGINQEGQAPPIISGEACYAGGEPLLSDQSDEEQFSDSDTDIPCFSVIEAMILGMDLGPNDEDSFFSRGDFDCKVICTAHHFIGEQHESFMQSVAKYLDEDAKRKLTRWEQHFHSRKQRDIAKHGALAVLYDGYSKYYIKKPKVLLGRGAEDAPVDIALGREGHVNMISRRQAIIMMDKDGTFYIKNLGKHSIYVNECRIGSLRSSRLSSDCLIQFGEISFIFDYLRQVRRV